MTSITGGGGGVGLDIDVDAGGAIDEVEGIGESGHRLVCEARMMPGAGIQIRQFGGGEGGSRTGCAGRAIEGSVMQQHGDSIPAEADIQLDDVNFEREGLGNGGSGVFGSLL